MSLFAISDLHLSFAETVEKPMDVFGPLWDNHEQRLANAWRELVSEEDYVLVPGDISWGISLEEAAPDLRFLEALPGKKILLRGNHDYWWSTLKKMNGKYKDIFYIQNNCFAAEDFVICGTRGWFLPWHASKDYTKEECAKIFERELLRLEMSLESAKDIREGRKLIAASHFPPLDNEHTGTRVTEIYQK